MNKALQLVGKDLLIELRSKASINGIFLYVVATVFITYMVFNSLNDLSNWIGIFWITLLFGATNATINSFKNESGKQFLYYYTLISAQQIILSKLIYNCLLILIVTLLNFVAFSLFLSNPIENIALFCLVIFLGSMGISSILTFGSAIASKTNNNSTLTAILSFPMLLPTLLISIKASILCGLGFGWEESQTYILALFLLNVVVIALSYILFPYLWRS